MGKQKGITWAAWRAEMISIIRAAATSDQLNKLWSDNEKRLDHEEMPAMARQAIEESIEDRRAELG